MSIAEFYTATGLDPSDPYHMDNYLSTFQDESDDESDDVGQPGLHGFSGLMIGYLVVDSDNSSTRGHVLDNNELDQMALSNGYRILDTSSSTAPMASYRKGAVRLNFWLTTGTVGSYLEHPQQGKTQLFRRDVTMEEAEDLFENPRIHTGRGYRYVRNNGGRGPCRYGDQCYRPDCWFDH